MDNRMSNYITCKAWSLIVLRLKRPWSLGLKQSNWSSWDYMGIPPYFISYINLQNWKLTLKINMLCISLIVFRQKEIAYWLLKQSCTVPWCILLLLLRNRRDNSQPPWKDMLHCFLQLTVAIYQLQANEQEGKVIFFLSVIPENNILK